MTGDNFAFFLLAFTYRQSTEIAFPGFAKRSCELTTAWNNEAGTTASFLSKRDQSEVIVEAAAQNYSILQYYILKIQTLFSV